MGRFAKGVAVDSASPDSRDSSPDPTHREACCLRGTRVKDIIRKFPDLVHPSDYCPLLTVQVGSDEVARETCELPKKREGFIAVG